MSKREATEQIRQQVIVSTDQLLYQKGYNLMSFSDIAEAAGVPRGNLYYYFKTKEDVLTAVIDYRIENMQQMLANWDAEIADPLNRLKRYVQIAVNESQQVIRYGCPMGSLNIELGKFQPELMLISRRQFDVFRQWLTQQFEHLSGLQFAEHHALHLLSLTQGAVLISRVYEDKALLQRELKQIDQWLDKL